MSFVTPIVLTALVVLYGLSARRLSAWLVT